MMPKFSANLTMLFNEVPFLDRFEKAAGAGFKGVEFMFPYEWEKDALAEKMDRYRLQLVLHNLPAGDWAKGERGVACLPERIDEFKKGVTQAIEYAKALKCFQVNCLVGMTPKNVPDQKVRQTLVNNLRFAASAMEKANIHLLVEPVNNIDMPGFYLTHTQQALDLMKEINHPNVWLQYDIYHMQVMEGNLTRSILSNLPKIGHIQLADNPGRHEPGTGEINFPNLIRFIDEAGYNGWIGCEYKPASTTENGLGWLKHYVAKGEK
jgi:hydroxypyruvate isomerase